MVLSVDAVWVCGVCGIENCREVPLFGQRCVEWDEVRIGYEFSGELGGRTYEHHTCIERGCGIGSVLGISCPRQVHAMLLHLYCVVKKMHDVTTDHGVCIEKEDCTVLCHVEGVQVGKTLEKTLVLDSAFIHRIWWVDCGDHADGPTG